MNLFDRLRDKHNAKDDILSTFLCRLSEYKVHKTNSQFDRRVTCIQWHPTLPHQIAVGSKSGDICIWNTNDDSSTLIQGKGKGGTITQLRYSTSNHSIFSASVDGRVVMNDLEGKHSVVFYDTMNWQKWFTGLDVGRDVIVGDTSGWVTLCDLNCREIFKGRLHKHKCQDIQTSPFDENMFVTCSNDKTVKVWDRRQLSEGKSVYLSEHGAVVSAVSWSPTTRNVLLSTAQNSECKILDLDAGIEKIWSHPHRKFQYLTNIEAAWHPLHERVFVIGRYPEADQPKERCVDIAKYEDGNVTELGKIYDSRFNGIHCVAKFNAAGELMASCSGMSALIWKRGEPEGVVLSGKRRKVSGSDAKKKARTKE